MTPIDNTLAELAYPQAPNTSAVVRAYGIYLSTLDRRWKGRRTPREEALSNGRVLNT